MNMTVTEFKARQHIDAIKASFHIPDDEVVKAIRDARMAIMRGSSDNRSRAVALTKLDEALLWWGAAMGESRPKDFEQPPAPPEGSPVAIRSRPTTEDSNCAYSTGTVIGTTGDRRLIVRDGGGVLHSLLHVDSLMPGAIGWDAN